MDSELLPFDILLLIAEIGPWAWRLMTTAIPSVGRYSLNKNVQRKMKKRWTTKEVKVDEYGWHTTTRYLLPNGKLYREKKPAVIERDNHCNYISMEEYYTGLAGRLHRDNNPSFIEYAPDGTMFLELYYKHGLLYRDNGPAVIKRRILEGTPSKIMIIYEEYCTSIPGVIHRDNDLPALIEYKRHTIFGHRGYKLNREVYCKNGNIHRDGDKPAYILYDFIGGNHILNDHFIEYEVRVVEETYYKNGTLHREGDKPAFIQYEFDFYENKMIIVYEKYYKNGNLHREGDKPAFIKKDGSVYGKTYNIVKEKYYKNGKRHRDGDKPALIEYDDQITVKEKYYKNGVFHRDDNLPAVIVYKQFLAYEDYQLETEAYYTNGNCDKRTKYDIEGNELWTR